MSDIEATIDHEQGNELATPEISIPDDTDTTSLDASSTDAPETTDETTDETPAPETMETAPETTDDAPATSDEPPAFEASYKYKVRDEEHEIDEVLRPLIKDEETQRKIVDLYTRGHGLELAKQEREEVQTRYDNVEQSLGILNGYVKQYYENPNQGAQAAEQFINALGLPKQMFLQYALSELKYEQLSPEQRTEVDAQRTQQTQLQQLQMQNEQLQTENRDTAVQYRSNELTTSLADPGVDAVAKDYDTRIGREGAFFDLVVERGIYHDKVNGQDISVTQAIQEATQMIGASIQSGTTVQPQAGQQVGTQAVQHQQQAKKPVLPNISGQGTASPVKRVVNSIDDIRKRHAELSAQG